MHNSKLALGCWIGACVFLVAYFFDFLWSGSVDFVHHYALVTDIAEFWQLPMGDAFANLGEMSIYPRLSHILAAIFSIFLGSPLMGMQLVVLLSLIILWSSIGFALQTLPRRACVSAILSFLILLVFNHYVLHIELYGSEILRNYFFAQLAAQAFVVLVIVLTLFAEKKATLVAWSRYLLLALAVLLAEGIHLLPALELFVMLVLLIFFDTFLVVKHPNKKMLLAVLVFIALGATGLVLHPGFIAMRAISVNNGGIALNYIHGNISLFILCAIVAFLSVLLLFSWLRCRSPAIRVEMLLLKYWGLFGLSISGLCILQMLLLWHGNGSQYACYKYVYGLNTILLLDLALLPIVLSKWFWSLEPHSGLLSTIARQFFPAIFILCVCFSILPINKPASLNALVQLEKLIVPYYQLQMGKPSEGKYNYAVNIGNWFGTYLVSLGMLMDRRGDPNLIELLRQSEGKVSLDKVNSIITFAGTKPWDILECRRHIFPNSLVILDGNCLQARMEKF